MNAKNLLERVRGLNLPMGKYALFGSALLCARGLRDCDDIDVVVSEDLWNEYKNRAGWSLRKAPHGSEYLQNDNVESWKDWKPGMWNIEELIQNAEIIDGIPFVGIGNVLKWKKLYGRPKDLKDVRMLESYIKK